MPLSSSPPSSLRGRKQATISSFFTRNVALPQTSPATPHGPLAKKRTQTSDDPDLASIPQPKRTRKTSLDDEQDGAPRHAAQGSSPVCSNDRQSLSTMGDAGINCSRSISDSDRTAKFMFTSSPGSTEDHAGVDTEQMNTIKQTLHERFVQKLGRPNSISEIGGGRGGKGEVAEESEDDNDDGSEEHHESDSQSRQKAKGKSAARKGAVRLTPMEKQVVDLKREYPDTILVVEVGYKFRFFGEDARVAAKELNIVCIPGKLRFDQHPSEAHLNRFAGASIPTHRLHVHVKRLVVAGHKVGVVRQIETAALKKAGDNRNAPFVRRLTNLYTKATYIDDIEMQGAAGANVNSTPPATGYILCLTETSAKRSGTDERVHTGIVAVQPATGDIVYDDFEDGFMRSEIETRLLHIAPCEFLLVGDMTKATEKIVQHLSGSKRNIFGDQARVERIGKAKTTAAQAYSHISSFYAHKVKNSDDDTDSAAAILDKVHRLSEHVTICLSALITHMTEYGLQHVFGLTKNFQAFSTRSHMLLNGNTLSSLEIYQNSTDHATKGSLFWAMDRTKTRFGQRQLRRWIGRPLLSKIELEERLGAVEELRSSDRATATERLARMLARVKTDLEKSLIRIYYRRCTRSELLAVLLALQRIADEYTQGKSEFSSQILQQEIAKLPLIRKDVMDFLDRLDVQGAKNNDKYTFFREQYETEEVTDHKIGIVSVEHDLAQHKGDIAAALKKPKIEYVTKAGVEFLVEVRNVEVKKVPASWAKISGTRHVSRFHTPEVIRLLRQRDQYKEALSAACDKAFDDFLVEMGSTYQPFRDCVQSLGLLDCLLSLAEISNQPGYVKPEYCDEACIDITAGRHPTVERLLQSSYVPNDTCLSSDGTRALLVTGPNMGGKSSYVRQVALICIMAQVGSYVPAASARLGLLDAVYTRMGAFDNMMADESTFMVELSETADMLRQASARSLVIVDELGRGTSTHDGVAIAYAVLDHLVRDVKALTLFITHYQSLAKLAAGFAAGELRNVHMRFEEIKDHGKWEEIAFMYELGAGVAHRSYGLNVARLANVPDAVLEVAAVKSRDLEHEMRKKSVAAAFGTVRQMLEGADDDVDLDDIVDAIEQL